MLRHITEVLPLTSKYRLCNRNIAYIAEMVPHRTEALPSNLKYRLYITPTLPTYNRNVAYVTEMLPKIELPSTEKEVAHARSSGAY